MAHIPLPKPSPPQPTPSWFVSFIEPALSIDLTKLNAVTFAALFTVAVLPFFETSQPPRLEHEDAEPVELGVGAEPDLSRCA